MVLLELRLIVTIGPKLAERIKTKYEDDLLLYIYNKINILALYVDQYRKSSIKRRGAYSKLDFFDAVLNRGRRLFKKKSKNCGA